MGVVPYRQMVLNFRRLDKVSRGLEVQEQRHSWKGRGEIELPAMLMGVKRKVSGADSEVF